jgi:transcriptional regulator with XRE-family HTH domain
MRRRRHNTAEDSAFLEGIAEQVAEHRRLRSLSQTELADLCGTSQPGIARLERGTTAPRVDTLLRVAEALDCDLLVEFRARTIPRGGH